MKGEIMKTTPFRMVFIIRVQYQITGSRKYRHDSLLKPNSKNVFGSDMSPGYATLVAYEAKCACMTIRDILAIHLSNKISTCPVSGFKKAVKNHILDSLKKSTPSVVLTSDHHIYNPNRVFTLDVKHDITLFPVPDYDTASLTAIIGMRFQIEISQIQNLRKFLSIDLLKQAESKIDEALEDAGLQSGKKSISDKPITLNKSVKAIKRFTKPSSYYQEGNTRTIEIISELEDQYILLFKAGIVKDNIAINEQI